VKWDIDQNERCSVIISRRGWAQTVDTDDAKRTRTLKVWNYINKHLLTELFGLKL